jgi:hypothetical protein
VHVQCKEAVSLQHLNCRHFQLYSLAVHPHEPAKVKTGDIFKVFAEFLRLSGHREDQYFGAEFPQKVMDLTVL